jgi:16S rRNA (uracil1498-N3)-methyltransferase
VRLFHLAEGTPAEPAAEVLLDPEETHHLCTVLRARPGDRLAVTDGCGRLCDARFQGRRGDRARLLITACREDPRELRPPWLRLGCAVVKNRRFEWALEKAVEAGVHAFVPLLAARAVVRPRSGKAERWSAVMRSAAKQAGRSRWPELAPATDLESLLATAAGDGPVYWGAAPDDAAGSAVPWSALAGEAAGETASRWLTFLVGPEGGWTTPERERLDRSGAIPVKLGPHVLRTETAALAGVLVLQAQRERRWSANAPPP